MPRIENSNELFNELSDEFKQRLKRAEIQKIDTIEETASKVVKRSEFFRDENVDVKDRVKVIVTHERLNKDGAAMEITDITTEP